jgi:hypothetical protein
MFCTIRHSQTAGLTAALALALMVLPQLSFAGGRGSLVQPGDGKVAAEAQNKLDKKQFKDVKVDVDGDGAPSTGIQR